MLVHFFGNKVNLLAEAIEWPFDPEVEMPRLLADGKRNVGRRLAELAIHTWDDEGTRHPVFTLLRAGMTEPEAAEMLRNFMIHRLYTPLTERLGSDKPELRAGLASPRSSGWGWAARCSRSRGWRRRSRPRSSTGSRPSCRAI